MMNLGRNICTLFSSTETDSSICLEKSRYLNLFNFFQEWAKKIAGSFEIFRIKIQSNF